jgi:hypothetical protein
MNRYYLIEWEIICWVNELIKILIQNYLHHFLTGFACNCKKVNAIVKSAYSNSFAKSPSSSMSTIDGKDLSKLVLIIKPIFSSSFVK